MSKETTNQLNSAAHGWVAIALCAASMGISQLHFYVIGLHAGLLEVAQ